MPDEYEYEGDERDDSDYVDDTFVVDNDGKAEWALRKLAELDKEQNRWNEVCGEQIMYYERRLKDETEKLHKQRGYFEGLLFHYFSTVKPKETATQASYKLPSGTLKLVNAKRDFVLADEEAAKAALEGTEYIKTVEKVDWAALKKTLRFAPDGDTVVTDIGEVIAGITYTDKPAKFTVNINTGVE